MRQTALLLIVSLLWSTTFAPLAAAAQASEADAAIVYKGMTSFMSRYQANGWRLEDSQHHALSAEQWLTGSPTEYTLTPPASSTLSNLVFHVRVFPATKSVLSKFALSVTDRDGRLLSRRMIQVDAKEDAQAARVRLEETLNSIENDTHTQAANHRNLLQRIGDWIYPTAHADERDCALIVRALCVGVFFYTGFSMVQSGIERPRTCGALCVIVGAIFLSWGFDLMMSPD